jgi:hypothetical protein
VPDQLVQVHPRHRAFITHPAGSEGHDRQLQEWPEAALPGPPPASCRRALPAALTQNASAECGLKTELRREGSSSPISDGFVTDGEHAPGKRPGYSVHNAESLERF